MRRLLFILLVCVTVISICSCSNILSNGFPKNEKPEVENENDANTDNKDNANTENENDANTDNKDDANTGNEDNINDGSEDNKPTPTPEPEEPLTEEQQRATMWQQLSDAIGENGDETVLALKELYAVYDPSVVTWLAQLYDPGVGGFYYSNSARDYYGFLPDVESTYQALNLIKNMGLAYDIGGGYDDIITEKMKDEIISFVRSLQYPNGFFYHPQWTVAMVDSAVGRRARDLSWCESILSTLGATPIYTTPNGMVGEGASNMVCPLRLSTVDSVSVVLCASYYDPRFESVETLLDYIDEISEGMTSFYGVAGTLTTLKTQIVTRDKALGFDGTGNDEGSLMKALVDWCDSKQNPETGLWIATSDYNAVDGVLKVSGIYNTAQREIPNAEKTFDSVVAAICSDTPLGSAVHSYNPWNSAANIISNISRYGKLTIIDGEQLNGTVRSAKMREYLYSVMPEAILATAEKISVFKNPDGSFSYSPTRVQSGVSIGMPVCNAGTEEGDMNATHLLVGGVLNGVYNCLGLAKCRVPLFGKAERELFLEIIEGLSPIAEEDKIRLDHTIDFDSDPLGDTSYADWTKITENPDGEGQALYLESNSGIGGNLVFPITSVNPGGNCLVYKSDIYIPSDGVDNKYFMQIIIGNAAMAYLHKVGDTVNIYESTKRSGNDNVTRLLATVPCDEWFSLELRYYAGDKDTVRLKWYVNGECVAVTDNFYIKENVNIEDAVPTSPTAGAKLLVYAMKSPAFGIYIDKLLVGIYYEEYTIEKGNLIYNIDAE